MIIVQIDHTETKELKNENENLHIPAQLNHTAQSC